MCLEKKVLQSVCGLMLCTILGCPNLHPRIDVQVSYDVVMKLILDTNDFGLQVGVGDHDVRYPNIDQSIKNTKLDRKILFEKVISILQESRGEQKQMDQDYRLVYALEKLFENEPQIRRDGNYISQLRDIRKKQPKIGFYAAQRIDMIIDTHSK